MSAPLIYLIEKCLSHLKKAGSTVRIMFFSRAFNTILPLLPRDMLVQTRVNHHLSAWILYYPTNRPQYVRVWGAHKNSSDSIPFLQIHLKLYNAAN